MISGQYSLPLKSLDRAMLACARVRSAVRIVAKDLGYKTIAALLGYEDKDGNPREDMVSQRIEESARHYFRPHELIAIMLADNRGLILAALCEELGFEVPERKIEPGSEDARLLGVLRDMIGAELWDVAVQKAGVRR